MCANLETSSTCLTPVLEHASIAQFLITKLCVLLELHYEFYYLIFYLLLIVHYV
jgi:hypothetical protein